MVQGRGVKTVDPRLNKPDSNGKKPEKKERSSVIVKGNRPARFCQSETLAHEIKVEEHAEHRQQMKWKYGEVVAKRQSLEGDDLKDSPCTQVDKRAQIGKPQLRPQISPRRRN
jgi:hypothetical protein